MTVGESEFPSEDIKKLTRSTVEKLEETVYSLIENELTPAEVLQNRIYETIEQNRLIIGTPKFITEELEGRYWEAVGHVHDTQEKIRRITDALDKFEHGEITEEDLKLLLPEESINEREEESLSKRKAAFKRERDRLIRLGIDPKEIIYDPYTSGFGADPYHLTTGRNRDRIHGNLNPMTAEGVFYHSTTDTHGGKVKNGKKGAYYKNRAGKTHRKK